MFALEVNKNLITVTEREAVTSGSQNAYVVQFTFSDEWRYLDKVVTFTRNVTKGSPPIPESEIVYTYLLDSTYRCMIPWEIMVDPYQTIYCGVYGICNNEVVLPTIWIDLATILLGVTTGIETRPPSPDVFQQILEQYNALKRQVDDLIATPLEDGKSAYEIAVENGFAGTETEWLESLKGEAGRDGVSPTVEVSEISDGHRLEITDAAGTKSFDVTNGSDGKDGADGKDAIVNGYNTVTIEAGDNVTINQNGSTLTISSSGGGESGPTYTAGDGIDIRGDRISVISPFKGIVSQDEFDSLPPTQQNSGVFFIPDAGDNSSGGSGSNSGVPSGFIGMWSGSIDEIPDGWALCDGTNGTPNLKDKFVLGAGSTYSVGDTGGEATHKLHAREMPSHAHSLTCNTQKTSTDTQAHDHSGANVASGCSPYTSTVGATTGIFGNGEPHNNMPPYYTLAFIMKL